MKKSIIAIAFLLLCPFYGVRAQERPFFDLSGKGWHLWQDKNAAWQTEDIYLTLEEARKSPVIVPTAGWDILTSAQTLSVQVPGTAEEYLQTQSGPEGDITGVTWWSRTMDMLEDYENGNEIEKKDMERLWGSGAPQGFRR